MRIRDSGSEWMYMTKFFRPMTPPKTKKTEMKSNCSNRFCPTHGLGPKGAIKTRVLDKKTFSSQLVSSFIVRFRTPRRGER